MAANFWTCSAMAYSDWQLNRLRDALRAYHDYGGKRLSQKFNWKDVAEAMAEELRLQDPPVAAERLRQFVEGNRSKDGAMRKFGSLKPESLEQVVAFVMSAGLLRPAEFEERAPSFQAAQRLLEFFDPSGRRLHVYTAAIFEGRYKARVIEERVFREFDLMLHHPSEPALMEVTNTEEVFDKKLLSQADKWDPEERRDHCRKRTVYAGWAIFTPEGNVMVFLREAANNGKNLHQFTLAADWCAPGTLTERLYLLRHDFPIEMEDTNLDQEQILRSILHETEKNIVVFRRTA
jgi:hypothetical protein